MKRAEPYGFIGSTVERGNLWHALTPQAFSLALLRNALEEAIKKDITVTDDAQAVKLTGRRPLLVEGHMDNIKITNPSDLKLAELYLKYQEPVCE